jgi:N-acetyl-alpha-D-muramate 1-phosphate uridylyltransferase
MKAMILAAGRGERMRPLTDKLPKPLLEAGGKPLIVWQIERLAAAGVRDFVINLAHLGHLIEAALGDGRHYGVSIAYSHEAEALDTAGGVANALPLLGTGPFLLASGDVYAEYDYAPLLGVAQALATGGRVGHLVMVETPVAPPYNFLLDAASGLVTEGHTPRYTFAGIGAFQPALFDGIGRGARAPLLPLLRDGIAGRALGGERFAGYYENLTTPADLTALDRKLRG